jgi:hypothetical protein
MMNNHVDEHFIETAKEQALFGNIGSMAAHTWSVSDSA